MKTGPKTQYKDKRHNQLRKAQQQFYLKHLKKNTISSEPKVRGRVTGEVCQNPYKKCTNMNIIVTLNHNGEQLPICDECLDHVIEESKVEDIRLVKILSPLGHESFIDKSVFKQDKNKVNFWRHVK